MYLLSLDKHFDTSLVDIVVIKKNNTQNWIVSSCVRITLYCKCEGIYNVYCVAHFHYYFTYNYFKMLRLLFDRKYYFQIKIFITRIGIILSKKLENL